MPRKEKYLVAFQCFCCFTDKKILVSGRSGVKKVHCDDERCEREHFERVKLKNSDYRKEYNKYLREVQSQVPLLGDDIIQKIFRREEDNLFEDKVCRGRIVKKDKDWVVVQVAPGGATRIYRRSQCLF